MSKQFELVLAARSQPAMVPRNQYGCQLAAVLVAGGMLLFMVAGLLLVALGLWVAALIAPGNKILEAVLVLLPGSAGFMLLRRSGNRAVVTVENDGLRICFRKPGTALTVPFANLSTWTFSSVRGSAVLALTYRDGSQWVLTTWLARVCDALLTGVEPAARGVNDD